MNERMDGCAMRQEKRRQSKTYEGQLREAQLLSARLVHALYPLPLIAYNCV